MLLDTDGGDLSRWILMMETFVGRYYGEDLSRCILITPNQVIIK